MDSRQVRDIDARAMSTANGRSARRRHDQRRIYAHYLGGRVAARLLGASAMMSGLLAFCTGPIGRWVVIGLLVAAAVTAAGMRAYNAGYAAHESETSTATAEANQRARIAERAASLRMAKVVTDHRKVVSDAQAQIDRLRGDVRSGARRLSVVTAGLSACPGATAAARSGAETRADIDPATADALVAIAADGDNAIRQANSLIDAYQVAAEVCGK